MIVCNGHNATWVMKYSAPTEGTRIQSLSGTPKSKTKTKTTQAKTDTNMSQNEGAAVALLKRAVELDMAK